MASDSVAVPDLQFHPIAGFDLSDRDLAKAHAIAKHGAVYLLQERSSSLVKIGWSRDVEARIAHLQTGNSSGLDLVGFIAGSRRVEAGLHEQFRDLHQRGEWFLDVDGDIVAVFEGLVARGY